MQSRREIFTYWYREYEDSLVYSYKIISDVTEHIENDATETAAYKLGQAIITATESRDRFPDLKRWTYWLRSNKNTIAAGFKLTAYSGKRMTRWKLMKIGKN